MQLRTSQSRYTVSYEQVSYATAIHNITPVTPATESHVQPSQKLHQHLISSPKWRSVCLCTIVVCVYKRSGSGIVDTPLPHPSHIAFAHDTPLDPLLLLFLAQGCVGLGDTQQNHFFWNETQRRRQVNDKLAIQHVRICKKINIRTMECVPMC